MTHLAMSNDPAPFHISPRADDEWVIAEALRILEERCKRSTVFDSPKAVRRWLTVRNAGREYEMFTVLFLDTHNRLIEAADMFRGTVSQTSVYPREVVREAMRLNASAVILSHNHPSSIPTPSRADETLTTTLKNALALVDVRVLDHIVTAGGKAVSMAEAGLI